jgi:hypothetical protein
MSNRIYPLAIIIAICAAGTVAWFFDVSSVKERITLIGPFLTAVGLVIAAWQVARQIRATARTREQDRIEKELPGLYAASELGLRFLELEPQPVRYQSVAARILDQFGLMKARQLTGVEFSTAMQNVIPTSPPALRLELAGVLQELRHAAEAFEHVRASTLELETELKPEVIESIEYTSPEMIAGRRQRLETERLNRNGARETLTMALAKLTRLREGLLSQIAAEEKRRAILRGEQSKVSGL